MVGHELAFLVQSPDLPGGSRLRQSCFEAGMLNRAKLCASAAARRQLPPPPGLNLARGDIIV